MTRNILILISLFFFGCESETNSKSGNNLQNMIPLSQIQEFFDNMHAQGVDTNKDMLYGYFFTYKTSDVLHGIAKVLEPYGFKYVEVYPDETGLFWLHVERIETHTPESLDKVNQQFYELAEKWKINSYDGFDVGNSDPNKPIERDTYVVQEDFMVGERIINDLPELIVLNSALDEFPHKSEFNFILAVNCKYESGNDAMLPTDKELESLGHFEMFVEENLNQNGVECYYVYRTSYDGNRNFYLALKDKENASGVLNFIKEHSKRNYTYEINEDSTWQFYKEARSLVNNRP